MIRKNLLLFTRFTKPDYEVSWHHREIAKALEEVYEGTTRRLIIACPPQRGKSELASIRFPLWVLARKPSSRIIITSYSTETAERFSREARHIAQTRDFRMVFPERKLSQEEYAVGFWRFQGYTGYIRAAGIGGPITSYGADLIIIDDPFKDREEADSEVMRQRVWDWFVSVALSRLSPQGAVVIIATRWHEDDLTGRLLRERKEEWKYLHIPAITEDRVVWEERWSREDYEKIRLEIGARDFEALYQGNPVPEEGAIFSRDYFKIIDSIPHDLIYQCRFWDLAISTKEGADYTVGAKIGIREDGSVVVLDIVRKRMEWAEARERIIECAKRDGEKCPVVVEGTAFQTIAIDDLARDMIFIRVPLHKALPVKDKQTRARALAARGALKGIYLLRAPWNDDLLEEVLRFPQGKHDDIVDALSGAFGHFYHYRKGKVEKEEISPWSYAFFSKKAKEKS